MFDPDAQERERQRRLEAGRKAHATDKDFRRYVRIKVGDDIELAVAGRVCGNGEANFEALKIAFRLVDRLADIGPVEILLPHGNYGGRLIQKRSNHEDHDVR